MIAELCSKSQITLPEEIVAKLGLTIGDKLDFFEKDGVIWAMPVVVYPKKYLDTIGGEINALRKEIAAGKQPVFASVDAMMSQLESSELRV
ncbi:MAG: AbrB/MazE/SpoVT family DNA-binding domain-containing protein [Planctomycetota bacterium]|jgi:bifunctional DNA-binding transcriptional regulator/antitoxin component of YhaV-PrlF toxin-antitoxin module|nr:AbrB/MazE/SpoVT family DNA-binding domain-containing protein [Planctomycetota bacterium]